MRLIFLLSLFLLSQKLYSQNCIAHRGDSRAYLENSLEALTSAVELNAHGIEFDLIHTKDNIALVMHDKTLKRTAISKNGKNCPLKSKIKKLSLYEIRENCLLSNGSEIPTLKDALEALKDYDGHLFIELKDSPSMNTLKLIARKRSHMVSKTRFISFKKRYLKKAVKLRDNFPIYKEMKMLNINLLWPFAGIRIGIDMSKWGQSFLFWARWHKKEIGIWTVDKESKIRELFKKKVPFITTNAIIECLEISKEFPR